MVFGPKTELILERKILTADDQGGYTETWRQVRKMKGVLISLRGNERFITGKTEVYRTHKFIVDYPKDLIITEKDRYTLGDRKFDIQVVVDPAEQHIHLEVELYEANI